MEFIFKGEEAVTYIYGLTFPNGVAVNVADDFAIAKLLNHPQFDRVVDEQEEGTDVEGGIMKRKPGRPKGK